MTDQCWPIAIGASHAIWQSTWLRASTIGHVWRFNTFTADRYICNIKCVIFIAIIDILAIFYWINSMWKPKNLIHSKSILGKVMGWCHHVPSHYLNWCWPNFHIATHKKLWYYAKSIFYLSIILWSVTINFRLSIIETIYWIAWFNILVITVHFHYNDIIMSAMASQITSFRIIYSTLYSGADQRKHQSSASLAFGRGSHHDRWIPPTRSQQCGKCFHLMTSSCMLCSWTMITCQFMFSLLALPNDQQL